MLAASGKVELLEGHYDEAIRTLARCWTLSRTPPPLLTDLATAYSQARRSRGSRGRTMDNLSNSSAGYWRKNPMIPSPCLIEQSLWKGCMLRRSHS